MKYELLKKIHERDAVIGVIGVGYIGLPLLIAFANKGYHTIGLEVNQSRVEALSEGRSYIGHIPSEQLQQAKLKGAGFRNSTLIIILSHPTSPVEGR